MRDFNYLNKNFIKDGEPFKIISGAVHYFRVPEDYWYDRLLKLKAGGFNTVETYAAWNAHEKNEGEFDFSGMLDIVRFIKIANELGLLLILRPGPYICAEWENGGLPPWLLTKNCGLRCNDPVYMACVESFFNVLLPKIKPYMYKNGGNIIAMQIENEYGSYGNDKSYLQAIADIYRKNDLDCIYFTSDGPNDFMLANGNLKGTLATVNFWDNPKTSFDKLNAIKQNQPFMCSEFWDGWFDHWGRHHHTRDTKETAEISKEMLSLGSASFFMYHGGTNFGFMNGANFEYDKDFGGRVYQPTITSYDYDAPVTEAGDFTDKFYVLKEIAEKYTGKNNIEVKNTQKKAYGKIELTEYYPLFNNLNKPVFSPNTKSMEELGKYYGYTLYSTVINSPVDNGEIYIDGLADRAHIFIDGEYSALYYRSDNYQPLKIKVTDKPKKLDILVENMGRINYGYGAFDRKGITKGVRIDGAYLFGWEIYSFDSDDLLGFKNTAGLKLPCLLKGTFEINEKHDTFVDTAGFTKGVVFINGINLGRYWDIGPQKTLYLPAQFLKQGKNEIAVFETDCVKSNEITLKDQPQLS